MALRLGLIGRGRWGRNIERTLASFPDVSVVPIGREAAPPDGLDGVLIATPSATHAEIALPYIEAGIATFIEKPMATSVPGAERIREAAVRSGAPIFVGHIYLYHPAFLAALALLPELGPVQSIVCEGANDRPRMDSSVLWDWLPHDLSMARVLFGQGADAVRAWKLLGDVHPEVVACEYQFGEARLFSLVSWHSSIPTRRVTITCEKAVVLFDDKVDRKLAVYRDGALRAVPFGNAPPLACEMVAFLKMVRTNKRDAEQMATGLSVVSTIVATERSFDIKGQWVRI